MLRRDPITEGGSDATAGLDSAPSTALLPTDGAAQKVDAGSYTIAEQKQAYGIPVDLVAKNESTLQMVWGPGTRSRTLA